MVLAIGVNDVASQAPWGVFGQVLMTTTGH